jgi:acyl-coenzyme A synthetase/AMP-(fatty) acid ligase
MPLADGRSLWQALSEGGNLDRRILSGEAASVSLSGLAAGSGLGGRLGELDGSSVLVAPADQLAASLALIELDGAARRLVLCASGVPADHIASVMAAAEIDAVISDRDDVPAGGARLVKAEATLAPLSRARRGDRATEWILLTSGTTGAPKLVVHTLASLAGPTQAGAGLGQSGIWSTFYDIRRYGGLVVFLRALLSGSSLVLSSARESTADFLSRAGARAVTHITGTPSHWRRALMSPAAHRLAPRYVRLSGEIADQAILDHLHAFYPEAGISHAFASTEAGVAFEVDDGLAGFPARFIGRADSEAELKILDGSLRIRSARTAAGYLGGGRIGDAEGFVDTGDMVELRGDRYYFVGRRDGIINVGGFKVLPEEVEAVLNAHPSVEMSLVKARRSPVTGAVVVADVVMARAVSGPPETVKGEILDACRRALPPYKVPAAIRFVTALDVTASGKLHRHDA